MSMPNEAQPMGGVQNRNEAFNQGQNGAGALTPAMPQSFLQRQQQMNPGGPAKVRMSGSGNGMSASQATNTMSGMLPDTGNGSAPSTYESKKWFDR